MHRDLPVGAVIELVLPRAGAPAAATRSAGWPDIVRGAGFAVRRCSGDGDDVHVTARRAATLADRVGPGLRMLVCGLNPSTYAARTGVAFARPGNRFWPALMAAGLATVDRDPDAALIDHGVGFTDLVKRATRAAAELDDGEYRRGVGRVERLVRWLEPGVVVFLGLSGYRLAVDRRAAAGPLPDGFGGRPAFLVGNPSGLNAHLRPDALAATLRAAVAAGGSRDRVGSDDHRPQAGSTG